LRLTSGRAARIRSASGRCSPAAALGAWVFMGQAPSRSGQRLARRGRRLYRGFVIPAVIPPAVNLDAVRCVSGRGGGREFAVITGLDASACTWMRVLGTAFKSPLGHTQTPSSGPLRLVIRASAIAACFAAASACMPGRVCRGRLSGRRTPVRPSTLAAVGRSP
jgi:hypothetical protein